MNPPKRQVFVDSFYFEEPNRRGTHKKSTTPRRATTKKPKANRKKAMPQPAAQPRKPKARVEPTPAEVEARQERQREYERRRAQTPERKELKRRSTQESRNKAKLLGICVGCGAPLHPGRDPLQELRIKLPRTVRRRTQEPAIVELAEAQECDECCLCPEHSMLAA